MLALKLGLSLVNKQSQGTWTPSDEASLKAWYQNAVGITLNGSDVSNWADSSSNSFDMAQASATNQPAYSAGTLTFNSADTNYLQSSSNIELPGAFTIGIRLNPSNFSNVIIGDNDGGGEFIKIISSSKVRMKINNSAADFDLDSGSFGDDYLVFTRDSSDNMTLYKNGVAQADTENKSGQAEIDAIGVRDPSTNAYDGTIKEIQIYTSSSAALTANVNSRLAGL